MIREIIHIVSSKSVLQEGVNCWLSYTMSQPVNFDLSIISFFMIQYLGITHLTDLMRNAKDSSNHYTFPNENIESVKDESPEIFC